MNPVPLNHLAVLACGVVSMILGFLWYGPLFGKQWIALMGFTQKQMEEGKKKGMGKSMLLMFIGAIIMAYVLAHSLVFASAYLNSTGVPAGLAAGFWNWLGFVVPVTLSSVIWEGKSWKLWIINIGYVLVQLCLMGMILAVWQ